MTSILILTDPHDEQSLIVTQALMHKQISVIRWFPQDFIHHEKGLFYLHQENRLQMALKGNCPFDFSKIQVVWYRAGSISSPEKNITSLEDYFTDAENQSYLKSVYQVLSHQAVWVNPFFSQAKFQSNAIQLIEAAKVGMFIPETLMTNDRDSIIDFMHKQSENEIIYKTFSSPLWKENGITYDFKSITLTQDMLPDKNILQLTPGIYQHKVTHTHSVMAVIMADKIMAFKHTGSSPIDWDELKHYPDLSITPYFLPSLVEQQCLRLMERLGIVFGCCHFLITPDKDHVFLSINENTAFLWLEKHLPECKLLDTFCDFIIQQANRRVRLWPDSQNKLSLTEILTSKDYQSMQKGDKRGALIRLPGI